MAILGIDTSNYTTSVALILNNGEYISERRLLPVKPGERGLRQSDAVFHHTKAYGELVAKLTKKLSEPITAVGVSASPTTARGSYMPCFLVGESLGVAVSSILGVPLYRFSHQQGHIAAACMSAERLELLNGRFIAFHVSGGTTEAVLCEPSEDGLFSVKELVNSTDLKAGQAVDRLGVRLGLTFPCGKELEALAARSSAEFKNKIKLYDGSCSLSGVENKCIKMLSDGASGEDTAKFLLTYIADTLSEMTRELLSKHPDCPVIFAGGVMSDAIIRDIIKSRFPVYFSSAQLSSDNAVGVALLAKRRANYDNSIA